MRYACPDAVIVRPGTMYGWEDRLLQYLGNTVTHPVKRWLTGGFIPMLDGGKRTFYPVYVNDVARGLYQFAVDFKREPKPLYEFIGPKPITYLELADLFCEYSRRPFSPLPLSYKTYR